MILALKPYGLKTDLNRVVKNPAAFMQVKKSR